MASKKIFLVDDDEMMCELLKIHFEQNSRHEIHVFHTGEECVESLILEPQVIILDYQLNAVVESAKDGLQILKSIKQFDPNVCVIMLSSQDQYGKAAQTIVKGAIEYVVKDDNTFSHIDKILKSLN